MSKTARLFAFVLAVSCFVIEPGHARAQEDSCNGCSVVDQALKAINQLGPGKSRSDLSAGFEPDGGIQTGEWGRYVYRKCRSIKIEVRFAGSEEGRSAEMLPEDRIVSISRPYLELPFMD